MGDMWILVVKSGKVYVGGEIVFVEYGLLFIQWDVLGVIWMLFVDGYWDVFIVWFDIEGMLEWVKVYGGVDSEFFDKGDWLNVLVIDDVGLIYIIGSYYWEMDFGGFIVFMEFFDWGKMFYLAWFIFDGDLEWVE